MKPETLVLVVYKSGSYFDFYQSEFVSHQAASQEILDNIKFFKNIEINIYRKTDTTEFFCNYPDCIKFLERLKSFSKISKGNLKKFSNTRENMVVHFMIGNTRSYFDIRGDLSKEVQKILET